MAPGLSERVIFRELFPQGLTLLDLDGEGVTANMRMSPFGRPPGAARPLHHPEAAWASKVKPLKF